MLLTEHSYLFNSIHLNTLTYLGSNFRIYIKSMSFILLLMEIVFLNDKKRKIIGLFTWLTSEQKYSNNISIKKKTLKSKQSTTKYIIKKTDTKTYNNTASIFIEISRKQKHSPSSTFIRLRILQSKRQDRIGNDDLIRIRLGKDKQFRKNSVSLVWRQVALKENNFWFEGLCYKDVVNNCYYEQRKCKEQ